MGVCEGCGREVEISVPEYEPLCAECIAGNPPYPEAVCPWQATDADECAAMRERAVAGQSDVIPACPVHGEYIEEGGE